MVNASQDKQLLLSQQYLQNRLPHAMLINSVSDSDCVNLSDWLIHLLICQSPIRKQKSIHNETILSACGGCKTCLLQQRGNFPDCFLLNNDSKTLGVEDIRAVSRFLEKKAQLGAAKVIVIPHAERLTTAAANALLKTLEEPSENSFIILTTTDKDRLLATIMSRCALYNIRVAGNNQLPSQTSSIPNSIKPFSSDLFEQYAQQFINTYQLPELTDNEVLKSFIMFYQCFLNYLNAENFENEILAHLNNNDNGFRWLEQITFDLCRQSLLGDKLKQVIKLNEPLETPLAKIYQTIIKSNKLLKFYTQLNRQFTSEKLIMSINAIIRPSS